MSDLEVYADKCAKSGRLVVKRAYEEAKSREHMQLTPEHVMIAITELERPFFNEVMQGLNVDPQCVLQALETRLAKRHYISSAVRMSESIRTLLMNSLKHAHERDRRMIEARDLFVGLFKDPGCFPVELLKRLGADREMVMQKIQTRAMSHGEREER